MAKNTKGDELEDKLIEELEGDYDETKGNRKLLIIGGVVAVILIVVAIVLSLFAGNKGGKTTTTPEGGETAADEAAQKPTIAYEDDYSRDAGSATAQKAGEPSTPYPTKSSGARVAVDATGKSIEGAPIQKSLMIDDRENPFHALHTIAPEIYDLMEVNLYSVQNKQLSLGELTDKTRLSVPDTIFNRLDNFYRIFMFRGADEKGPGTAIVFSTGMDKNELSGGLTSWENTMVNNFRSFVNIGLKKDFVEASGQKNFQTSSLFRGARFVDFSDNGVVSLNYIVIGKYIVFANSRSTFEKTINLLQK
jgi:hypothetical protein